MPAGVPKNTGDSKDSTPRMKLRMKALVRIGSISTRVMRQKVRPFDAPDMRLDSSSDGSIVRNASTMKRKRKVVEYCIMCQTTPPYEYMLTIGLSLPESAFHTRLMVPD